MYRLYRKTTIFKMVIFLYNLYIFVDRTQTLLALSLNGVKSKALLLRGFVLLMSMLKNKNSVVPELSLCHFHVFSLNIMHFLECGKIRGKMLGHFVETIKKSLTTSC